MNSRIPLPTAASCLFLDVDGTLIEFSSIPTLAAAPLLLKESLNEVSAALGGALALVSGRRVADLDTIFFPLRLPCAGVHGGERRDRADLAAPQPPSDSRLDPVRERIHDFARLHPGVVVEDKAISFVVHFQRNAAVRPVLEHELQPLLAALGPEFHAMSGHMAIEIKPRRFSKAAAIEAFLLEPPFKGRTPIFIGDDVTDLDGFRAIEARNGTSIAVGDRVHAQWWLPDPAATRRWLGEFAAICRA
jgi:trehalose 6-phosphate phosphatase